MSSRVLLRSALVALALLVVAWLALALRATRLEAEGREVVDRAQRGDISDAEVNAGLDTLRRARRFNEDNEPRLAEAALLADAGRLAAATAVAERVVDDEPENLEGWVVLYLGAAATGDMQRSARALRTLITLNPQLAERVRSRVSDGP